MTDNWSPCPRCGSNRVQKVSKWVIAFAFFFGGSFFIWLGILFPLLWLAVPIAFIIGIIIALFGKNSWQCQDCKFSWPMKKQKHNSAGAP